MIEIIGVIFALLIVLTMGGMCFDWIGSGMVDPIYREESKPDTPQGELELKVE